MKQDLIHADRFEVVTGSKEYEVVLKHADCHLEYTVWSDHQVVIYVKVGDKVLPLNVGHSLKGRCQLKDAKFVLVSVSKPSAIVAMQFLEVARNRYEPVDDKPLAVHVPALPPIDLRTMVSRAVGQKLQDEGLAQVERDSPDLPDDIDEEFGLGATQMEEDEDIEEAVRVHRERAAAVEKASREKRESGGESSRDEGGDRDGEDRTEPSVRPKRRGAARTKGVVAEDTEAD